MELDKEMLSKMSKEQKAEYEKLIQEIAATDKKLISLPEKSFEEIMEEKRLELEQKKEEARRQEIAKKDDEAYNKACKVHGFKNLAVQENPNGAVILRKPTNKELREFQDRVAKNKEDQKENITQEFMKEILVHPDINTFKTLMEEHHGRWMGLGEKLNELVTIGGQARQKKA